MELIGQYRNGNYTVRLYDDGTKVRETSENSFIPEFPESMDLKITDQCDMGCPFCHENSTPQGTHGDILNLPFLETLKPHTEIAIGGGNPLSHPDLIPFLRRLRRLDLIPNITVNQKHFLENVPLLLDLTAQRLIYGLGVSYTGGPVGELIPALLRFPNAVLHVINGVVSVKDLRAFSGCDFKLLILGYKTFRRGKSYFDDSWVRVSSRYSELFRYLGVLLNDHWFSAVSFDNLAIRQLGVRRLMTDEQWQKFYMGDDGQFTMYIDAVHREYAVSSTVATRYPLEPDIQTMFQTVRESRSSHGRKDSLRHPAARCGRLVQRLHQGPWRSPPLKQEKPH